MTNQSKSSHEEVSRKRQQFQDQKRREIEETKNKLKNLKQLFFGGSPRSIWKEMKSLIKKEDSSNKS